MSIAPTSFWILVVLHRAAYHTERILGQTNANILCSSRQRKVLEQDLCGELKRLERRSLWRRNIRDITIGLKMWVVWCIGILLVRRHRNVRVVVRGNKWRWVT